jgi:hypothetical protein|tara:strand:- start:1315 stop:1782 length:468 start_codon:yes stop_codon:yes gene_type:complete
MIAAGGQDIRQVLGDYINNNSAYAPQQQLGEYGQQQSSPNNQMGLLSGNQQQPNIYAPQQQSSTYAPLGKHSSEYTPYSHPYYDKPYPTMFHDMFSRMGQQSSLKSAPIWGLIGQTSIPDQWYNQYMSKHNAGNIPSGTARAIHASGRAATPWSQ